MGLLFMSADGCQWEPLTVFGGVLHSTDVLSLSRSCFPRNSMMLLYDATTSSRLRTDHVTKLEPNSTGHVMIATPLLDALDYRGTSGFRQRACAESARVDGVLIVSRCLVDNLERQMESIQRQVDDTRATLARHREETEQLCVALVNEWQPALADVVCPNGRDAWSALAMFPDSVERIKERVAAAQSEFDQLATEVDHEVSRQKHSILEQSRLVEESVEKFYKSLNGDYRGSGLSSRNNSAGSGSAGGASAIAGGAMSPYLQRMIKYVDTFRKSSLLTIAQWRTHINRFRALGSIAEPIELKTVRTFTEVLPTALQELHELMLKRCGIFRAALTMSSHVEKSYMELVGGWSSWSAKYASIQEPLARAAPQLCELKDLPTFLLPRCHTLTTAYGSESEHTVEAHSNSLLAATAVTLQPFLTGSDGSASSPGLPSRQGTATPVYHFSSPDETGGGPLKNDATGVFAGAKEPPTPTVQVEDQQPQQAAKSQARIAELEDALQHIQRQLAELSDAHVVQQREHIEMVQAMEESLSRKEHQLKQAENNVKGLFAQMSGVTPPTAAPAPTPSPLVEAVSFLEAQFQDVANAVGLQHAFGLDERHAEGVWTVPPAAPPMIAQNQFHVMQATRSTSAAATHSEADATCTINEASMQISITLTLKKMAQPTSANTPYSVDAEIHEGNIEQHVRDLVLNKNCTFELVNKNGISRLEATYTFPPDPTVRPDLRGMPVTIIPERAKAGTPLTIIQVNSVSEKTVLMVTVGAA